MTTNYVAAGDDMARTFDVWWKARATPLATYIPEIRYPGVKKEDSPVLDKIWGRFSRTVVLSNQTTMRNGETKRHTTIGNVFVQLFAPKSQADGERVLQTLGEMGMRAFAARSLSGNIWFRSPRCEPLPDEPSFYRLNIVAEYEYDQSI